MEEFLKNPSGLKMKKLHAGENENNPGLGANMAADFLTLSLKKEGSKTATDS